MQTWSVPKQFKIPRLCTMILICGPVYLSLLKKQRCAYVFVSSEGSDVEKQSKTDTRHKLPSLLSNKCLHSDLVLIKES